ncbi:Nicotinate phosphoribosyltransferase [Buchnera aphidicola (Thelaxes suberi)]|uniref:nicotinate phosphoribosyltransferase n=1 Tax=Buchnera aphidicola TaxID=9 RepID=UPI003463C7A5
MTLFKFPIITTLLDTDVYKFYMQQAVFFNYKNVHVVAELKCRNNENLGIYANILRTQVDMLSELKLTQKEYKYMSSFSFFKKEYLDWLKNFRFNTQQVQINNINDKLYIKIVGLWKEVILWEVPLLSLISEIVNTTRYQNIKKKIIKQYIKNKIFLFLNTSKNLDLSNLKIVDFGTRRRFSYEFHIFTIKLLKKYVPWFSGSSNLHISRLLNLPCVGTQSHEWFQAHQQISTNLKDSQKMALNVWLKQYGKFLNIALTDCITTDVFLKDFSYYYANAYKGVRHDSGDPIQWGNKIIHHYKLLNINPKKKILVFSDSLNFKRVLFLYNYFNHAINLVFGIGTYLTCDIPDVRPLNIVIKLIECNSKPVAKISDNPKKTFCLNKDFIRTLCKEFNFSIKK